MICTDDIWSGIVAVVAVICIFEAFILITTGQTTLEQVKKYVENQGKERQR